MSDESERLLHYLSLARTATSEQAAEICVQATGDAHLYHFGELLSSPPIASLATTHQAHHRLLRLFAHGTVADYKADPSSFPPLSPSHWQKLRMLTLITLAHGHNTLAYDDLIPALAVNSVREVETVVIDAIYAQLLRARMHQSNRTVSIAGAVGRDVTPDAVNDMRNTLTDWLSRATRLVTEIENRVDYIKEETDAAQEARAKAKQAANAVRGSVMSNSNK